MYLKFLACLIQIHENKAQKSGMNSSCICLSIPMSVIYLYIKWFSSLEGSEIGSHPYRSPLFTKLTRSPPPTCPLRKLSDCRLCLAPGLRGMFWNRSSCDSPRECPFLVLLHGHAGQSPSLMKEFPRQVGGSAVRCYLALIPAGKGNQGQPTWLHSPQNLTTLT